MTKAERIDEALERLHKFAVEWKIMQDRGGRDGCVYELHPGDPRHAVCKIDDIIILLDALATDRRG